MFWSLNLYKVHQNKSIILHPVSWGGMGVMEVIGQQSKHCLRCSMFLLLFTGDISRSKGKGCELDKDARLPWQHDLFLFYFFSLSF